MDIKPMSIVNEDRLLKLIPDFFEKPENVLIEIAQNAVRSGATKLDITLNGNVLRVSDNGSGTDNPKALFTLADSDWGSEVEENQKPAGWGLFFLLSIANFVTFKSRFGSVTVDCNRFLKEREYREGFWNLLDAPLKTDYSGFSIEAILKDGIGDKILREQNLLIYFPLDIRINGKLIDKGDVESIIKADIKTSYHGNDVYISIPCTYAYRNRLKADFDLSVGVLWYGIPIGIRHYYNVIIDVKNGSPLTPVLPYRHAVKRDDKYAEFMNFVKQEIVNFSIQSINSGTNKNVSILVSCMVAFATQEEINSLNHFCVVKYQPYHDGENVESGGSTTAIVTRKDMPLISEDIEIKGVEEYDKNDVFLPENTVTLIELPNRFPDWVKVENVVHTVNIKADENSQYIGHHKWFKSAIDSKLNIDVVAISNGWNLCKVYYKDDPDSFIGVSDVVFDNKYYGKDGDSWEAQKSYYDDEINNDISHIVDKHDISVLLKPFHNVGVSPNDILNVAIINNQMVVRTTQGERVLGLR